MIYCVQLVETSSNISLPRMKVERMQRLGIILQNERQFFLLPRLFPQCNNGELVNREQVKTG